jgi:hypothetical protein
VINTTTERITQLKTEIQRLRAKMIETYTDPEISYNDALSISQELDLLIVEYHKLLSEINSKHRENKNQS